MNKDFRVSIALTDHPKTIKLMRRLGDRSFFNLMRLWGYVAVNKPNGQLSGVDVEDIEIAADWRGEPGLFVSTLLDLGFLDQGDLMLCVHDWMEHNEFAAYSKERSEKARQAARKRWTNDKGNKGDMLNDAKSNATSINEQCEEHTPADAKIGSSNAPSPTPSPKPKPSPSPKKKNKYSLAFENFWSAYPKKRSKDDAWKAWNQRKEDRPCEIADIVKANILGNPEWKKEGGRYIPYPGTWLRAGGWNDEIGDSAIENDCAWAGAI